MAVPRELPRGPGRSLWPEPAHFHYRGQDSEMPKVPTQSGMTVTCHQPLSLTDQGCLICVAAMPEDRTWQMTLVSVFLQMNHLRGHAMVSFVFLGTCHQQSGTQVQIPTHTFPLFPGPGVSQVPFQGSCDVRSCSGPIMTASVRFPTWVFCTAGFTRCQ